MLEHEFVDKYMSYLDKIGCKNQKDILLALSFVNGYSIDDILSSNDREFNRILDIQNGIKDVPEVRKYRLLNDLIYCISSNTIKPSLEISYKVKKLVTKHDDLANTFQDEMSSDQCKEQILTALELQDLELNKDMCDLALKFGNLLQSFEYTYCKNYIISLPFRYDDFVQEHKDNEFKGCSIGYEDSTNTTDRMFEIMTGCCLLKASTMNIGETMYVSTVVDAIKGGNYIPIKKPSVIQGINSYEELRHKNKALFDFITTIFTFEDARATYTYENVSFLMALLAHIPMEEIKILEDMKNECYK